MTTIICQKCGERTSTAVCSNCGYLNSTSKTDNYNIASSFQDSDNCKNIDAEFCLKSWKKTTAVGRLFSIANLFSTIISVLYLMLSTLASIAAIILYIFQVFDITPLIATATTAICFILLILSIPLVIITEITRVIGIRSYCIKNNLRVYSDTNEKPDIPILDAYATSQSSGKLAAYLILHSFEVMYSLFCQSLLITLPIIYSFFVFLLPELNVVSIIIIPIAPLVAIGIVILIPTIVNVIISKIKNAIIYK